jgi:hypothetical protein
MSFHPSAWIMRELELLSVDKSPPHFKPAPYGVLARGNPRLECGIASSQ